MTDSGGAHALPLLPREAVDPRGAVPAHKRRYHASMQATKFKVGDFVKHAQFGTAQGGAGESAELSFSAFGEKLKTPCPPQGGRPSQRLGCSQH